MKRETLKFIFTILKLSFTLILGLYVIIWVQQFPDSILKVFIGVVSSACFALSLLFIVVEIIRKVNKNIFKSNQN